MPELAILTDSTAYLSPNFLQHHPMIHVLPLKIHCEKETYLDGVEITPNEFYLKLTNGCPVPTTSQPSAGEFLSAFKELAQEYDGVLVPLISSGISGTVDSALCAAAEIEDFPVEVIDTHITSAGLALIVKAAARAIAAGADLEAVREVCPDLRIKPILTFDSEGKIDALERIRTRKKALQRLLELVQERANGKPVYAGVVHAQAPEEAEALKKELEKAVSCQEVHTYELSPVIGTHVGPGTLGVSVYTSN